MEDFNLKWSGDLGLELHVADKNFPNAKQYADSLELIKSLNKMGVSDKMALTPHSTKDEDLSGLQAISDGSTGKSELPFLVAAYSGEMGAVLGYSGKQRVIEFFER